MVQLVLSLTALMGLGGLMTAAIFQGTWIKVFFPGLVILFLYLSVTARGVSRTAEETVRAIDSTSIVPLEGGGREATQTIRPEAAGSIQKIGRYEILGELGHGAIGVV